MVQRPDESVAFAIFCRRHWRLRLDDRVDTANCKEGWLVKSRTSNMIYFSRTSMGNLSGYFEEDVVLHLPLGALSAFARHCERSETICAIRRELRCLLLSRISLQADSSGDSLIWAGAAGGRTQTKQSAGDKDVSFGGGERLLTR